jgi:hypothetical protein
MAKARKLADHGIFAPKHWRIWQNCPILVALPDEASFVATLKHADPENGTAEVRVVDPRDWRETVGLRTIDWPPAAPGKITVIRQTPVGQATPPVSTGRGNFTF